MVGFYCHDGHIAAVTVFIFTFVPPAQLERRKEKEPASMVLAGLLKRGKTCEPRGLF